MATAGASSTAPQSKLLDLGPPFISKPNVVAYERHVLFASDDPADAARHSASGPMSTTRIDEAFVHEMPEQRVRLVFAQALFSPVRASVRLYSTLRRQRPCSRRCAL